MVAVEVCTRLEKEEDMKTKPAMQIALIRGAAFAMVTAVYLSIGGALPEYLWCVYLGFLVTMAFGAQPNLIPNYLFSFLAGYFWAVVYIIAPDILGELLPDVMASSLAELLVTGTLLFVHLRFFSETWLNKIPAVFAAVATVFAMGGMQSVPLSALSGCVGILMAIGTQICLGLVQKNSDRT